MTKGRKYTTITQLHAGLNNDIIKYFDETVAVYSVAFRQTFHKIKNNPNINLSKLNTEIQKEYKVTRRTANSIIRDAKGRISAINLLNVHNREKHGTVDCSRYDNDKLGSVFEINEEVLNFNSQISMYEAICQNNIFFTKEIDIENINLDFLDEAIKITNENDFVESRRHL